MTVTVEVCNLGPLRSAELELADLTLLIGENNTGKTFFATVLHRVLDQSQSLGWSRRSGPDQPPDEVAQWISSVLDPPVDEGVPATSLFSPSAATLKWAKSLTLKALQDYGASVRYSIAYAFGVEPALLRRRTPSRYASDCFVKVTNSEPDWQVEIRFDSDEIKVQPPDPKQLLQTVLSSDRILDVFKVLGSPPRSRKISASERSWSYWARFNTFVSSELFPSWPNNAVHLPADRSGIMQSHNMLAAAAVRQSARAGIRPIEIETLPGTSADFLSLILEGSERIYRPRGKSPFASLASRFEKDNIRAEIEIERRTDGPNAIVANTPEGSFPMTRVSSMLSELAPLLLVLKLRLGVDHLTIDEPEAHLHPEMQRQVATFFADLVNKDMRIVVTTHSDFFVAQFNNILRQHALNGSTSSLVGEGLRSLDPSRVRALRFYRENGKCLAQLLPPDRLNGIDESNFTDVMRSQYDETAGLVNQLLEAESGG